MNVALSSLPDFAALPGAHHQPHHESGIVMAPSLAYMEDAWIDARRDGWGARPIVEMLIPVDRRRHARAARRCTSRACSASTSRRGSRRRRPHARYVDGWADDRARDDAADRVIATVARFAPSFAASVIARQVHTPLDLERKFGLVGGDIFHGALSLDQLFSRAAGPRPRRLPQPDRAALPVRLGHHPGGGVTGLPGRNAAREILRDR